MQITKRDSYQPSFTCMKGKCAILMKLTLRVVHCPTCWTTFTNILSDLIALKRINSVKQLFKEYFNSVIENSIWSLLNKYWAMIYMFCSLKWILILLWILPNLYNQRTHGYARAILFVPKQYANKAFTNFKANEIHLLNYSTW